MCITIDITSLGLGRPWTGVDWVCWVVEDSIVLYFSLNNLHSPFYLLIIWLLCDDCATTLSRRVRLEFWIMKKQNENEMRGGARNASGWTTQKKKKLNKKEEKKKRNEQWRKFVEMWSNGAARLPLASASATHTKFTSLVAFYSHFMRDTFSSFATISSGKTVGRLKTVRTNYQNFLFFI